MLTSIYNERTNVKIYFIFIIEGRHLRSCLPGLSRKVDIRRDGTPSHCKWCWNFIEVTQTAKKYEDAFGRVKENRPLKYKRIRNDFEEELRRKLRREVEALQPDRRGGE
jgi:hypothetical protein